jgi:hypothetical protein
MHAGKIVFAQLTDLIHPEQFRRCVRRYNGNYKVKSFPCWNQFLCMAFGQLTFRESLRDVETCLGSRQEQLYHLGIRGEVSHSTLADANRERDWRIYFDLAQAVAAARASSTSMTSFHVNPISPFQIVSQLHRMTTPAKSENSCPCKIASAQSRSRQEAGSDESSYPSDGARAEHAPSQPHIASRQF